MMNSTIASIFKAYDIRGVYEKELTEEIAYRIARSYATLIQNEKKQEEGGEALTIVVGKDMRLSSPSLSAEVIRGLCDQGMHVVDIGLVSTPAFYYAVAKYGYDGGLMISASHNPAQYNGIKIVRAGAVPVSKDTGIFTIRDMVLDEGTIFEDPAQKGTVSKRDDIIVEQVKSEMEFAGIKGIRPLRIIADAANSMGVTYLRELFSHIPCTLIDMNFELDGSFPAHEADPFKEENNRALMKRIVDEKADFGIATDGDGDRIFFFDNEGKLIDPAIVRGLIAQLFLKENPGATICYDIRPGRITRDLIEQAGGKPSVTKVGHSLIKEQAIQEGAVFAGESSGHFFVKMDYGMFEAPVIVSLKLLQFFSVSQATVAEQVRPYRKYFHSGEINSTVNDKNAVMKKIFETYGPQAKEISELDGVTIEYDDFWFNVRGSNTEPLLRLNLEARTKELQEEKTAEVLRIIRG
ncbi:MAG TPA: phosphomannomutase/phosphoglucomutase [Patescibacteria group bacterium]|nr:phosphomannomutase/phosphoglucomutase [Patescibacteria group bacterium]